MSDMNSSFLGKAKRAAKVHQPEPEPINYGAEARAERLEKQLDEVSKANRSLADEIDRRDREEKRGERRKSDLDFFGSVLDRLGLDTAVIKDLGARIVARIGQSIDRDNSLQDEGRRMNQLRQLEIDLRYAGRSEAADAIALRIADALAAKL